jgi:hypothetical protein
VSATVRRVAVLLLTGSFVAGGAFAQQQPAAPGALPGGRIERPEVKVGDVWKYRVTDTYTSLVQGIFAVEVAAVTADRIQTRRSRAASGPADPGSGAEVLETWDRDWNLLAQGGVEYKPYYPTLRFPLEPGKQWTGAAEWRTGSGIMTHTVTAQVVGWERITVPAGSFDAVRITRRGDFIEAQSINYYAGNGVVADVIWYAPAIGQIVRKDIRHRDVSNTRYSDLAERWELVEFRRH